MSGSTTHGIEFEGRTKGTGFFVGYWDLQPSPVGSERIGDLIREASRHIRRRAREAYGEPVLDLFPLYHFEADAHAIGEYGTFAGNSICYEIPFRSWSLSKDKSRSFCFPNGVIPDASDGLRSIERIKEGFSVQRDGIEDSFVCSIVADQGSLDDLWFELLQLIPSVDNLEVRVSKALPGMQGKSEVWLTPEWASPQKLKTFLRRTKQELLYNGWVELGVYSREAKTTLRLADHKSIDFYAQAKGPLEPIVKHLTSMGLPRRKNLESLAHRHVHFHYAPSSEIGRRKVLAVLKAARAKLVDSE